MIALRRWGSSSTAACRRGLPTRLHCSEVSTLMNSNTPSSSTTPLFSIGITTYDRVEMLIETLHSVLDQTCGDFEVIIGNDNPGRRLTAEFLKIHDPRVRIVNHERNLGELGNMNELVRLGRGRYFTWLADDDLLAPRFLDAMREALTRFDYPP